MNASAAMRLAAAAIAVCSVAAQGHGQELIGTLKKIHDSKTVTLGYRASSIPFSYLDKVGEPIGYSIDLCNAVVADIRDQLEGLEPKVVYRKVTAADRIEAVRNGEVDLECGSTTANFARKLGAGDGTTNEAAVRAISDKQALDIKIVVGKDHDESFALLVEGKADAFATDDVLLYGLVAARKAGDRYHVVGDDLSYDPYGLMYRKDDPDFAAVVERTFARLAQSREIVQLYNRWFQMRLPGGGESLDVPAARRNPPRRRRPGLITTAELIAIARTTPALSSTGLTGRSRPVGSASHLL